jgi:two-component system sensor histidine kinase KdpD
MKQLAKGLEKRHVVVDIPASLPLVHIDPVLMEQVFVNILDNAVKYTAEGGEIAIEAEKNNGDLIVRVSDNGVGIPQEARNAVFDIFYRVRAKDSQIAGTGLGLSICRGIIEAHGGRITAKDSPFDKGITIEITLPLGEAPAMPEREPQEQLSEEASVG